MTSIPHDFSSSLASIDRLRRRIRNALVTVGLCVAGVAYFAFYFFVGSNA